MSVTMPYKARMNFGKLIFSDLALFGDNRNR